MRIPAEPVIFMKSSRTVTGPYDDILIPPGSKKTDWEVELGVVIGKECRYAGSDEEARSSIAGYCISHDVSEREFQLERGGQWVKGKSCDSFNPLGPYLVPATQVADPQALVIFSINILREMARRGTGTEMRWNWSRWDSNPRPSHCERDALPTELRPHGCGDPERPPLAAPILARPALDHAVRTGMPSFTAARRSDASNVAKSAEVRNASSR